MLYQINDFITKLLLYTFYKLSVSKLAYIVIFFNILWKKDIHIQKTLLV